MRRIHVYGAVWVAVTAGVILLRLTSFSGAGSDERWQIAVTYVLMTWVPVMFVNAVEQRQLDVKRGRASWPRYIRLSSWLS